MSEETPTPHHKKGQSQEDEVAPDGELRSVLERQRRDDQRQLAEDALWANEVFSDLEQQAKTQEHSVANALSTWPTWARTAIVLLTSMTTIAIVFMMSPRRDLHVYPPARMALALTTMGMLSLWLGGDALRSWHRPALTSTGTRIRIAVAVGLLVVLSILPAPVELSPYTNPPRGVPLLVHASSCFFFGLMVALPTFAMCYLAGRKAPFTTWVAAAVAGLVGNLALQLHCPITEHAHLLAGHASLGIAALGFAAALLLMVRKNSLNRRGL